METVYAKHASPEEDSVNLRQIGKDGFEKKVTIVSNGTMLKVRSSERDIYLVEYEGQVWHVNKGHLSGYYAPPTTTEARTLAESSKNIPQTTNRGAGDRLLGCLCNQRTLSLRSYTPQTILPPSPPTLKLQAPLFMFCHQLSIG